MIPPELVAVALLGLGGSFGHCIGMCGGFALAIGRGATGVHTLFARHLAYQAGKALTYVGLAVLLTAGFGLLSGAGWFAIVQTTFALIAGLVMLLYGFMQLAEWRPGTRWTRLLEPFPGCRALGEVVRRPGLVPAFFTGWLNGFLPCGLVIAMLLQMAATASVSMAALGAALFGAATFPGLFLFGWLTQSSRPPTRRLFVRITGALLIVFGVVTILRAFPAGRHWLHELLSPITWARVREWCGF